MGSSKSCIQQQLRTRNRNSDQLNEILRRNGRPAQPKFPERRGGGTMLGNHADFYDRSAHFPTKEKHRSNLRLKESVETD